MRAPDRHPVAATSGNRPCSVVDDLTQNHLDTTNQPELVRRFVQTVHLCVRDGRALTRPTISGRSRGSPGRAGDEDVVVMTSDYRRALDWSYCRSLLLRRMDHRLIDPLRLRGRSGAVAGRCDRASLSRDEFFLKEFALGLQPVAHRAVTAPRHFTTEIFGVRPRRDLLGRKGSNDGRPQCLSPER